MKISLMYAFTVFYEEKYHWMIITIMLVMSAMAYFNFRNNWPFYHGFMNRYMNILTGIFLWCNLCLFGAKALEHTEFDGSLQICILGIPLVVFILAIEGDKRANLLNKSIENCESGLSTSQ